MIARIDNAFHRNPMLFCGQCASLYTIAGIVCLIAFMPPAPDFVPSAIAILSEKLWLVLLMVGLIASAFMLRRGWRYHQFREQTKEGRIDFYTDQNATAFSLNRDSVGHNRLNLLSRGKRVSWQLDFVRNTGVKRNNRILAHRVSNKNWNAFVVRVDNPDFDVNLLRVLDFQTVEPFNDEALSNPSQSSDDDADTDKAKLFLEGLEFVRAQMIENDKDGISKREIDRRMKAACIQSLTFVMQSRSRYGLSRDYGINKKNYAAYLVENVPLAKSSRTVENWFRDQ
ncbi:hypothetical protein [Pacificispira sp.]|uniref:hypothetical protein n=1 Tax=Pacificispira sp. TaxID=2888761 RepID=UPI003BA85F21